MSEQQIKRRNERKIIIARTLLKAVDKKQRSIAVPDILKAFPEELSFTQLPNLHVFLERLQLTLCKPGQGKGRRARVVIDKNCLRYIAEEMGLSLQGLVSRHSMGKAPKGCMSVAKLLKQVNDLPEFAPLGDPVFRLETAPRYRNGR